jgi:hypothetical protein
MLGPSASSLDVTTLSHYLDLAEFVAFRVTLFALFLVGLYRFYQSKKKG